MFARLRVEQLSSEKNNTSQLRENPRGRIVTSSWLTIQGHVCSEKRLTWSQTASPPPRSFRSVHRTVLSSDVEGSWRRDAGRGDGKGVCCDRQSKVGCRDNCLRWALSRQVLQREPIITLWCGVLSSPCIQNVPYSKPKSDKDVKFSWMFCSSRAELVLRCT